MMTVKGMRRDYDVFKGGTFSEVRQVVVPSYETALGNEPIYLTTKGC
jgi:hypothetical protein